MNALREIIASFGINVETEELEHAHGTMGKFKEQLEEFGKTLLTAFAVEKVVDFGKEILADANNLRQSAIALGTTTEELEKLDYAAQLAGVSTDELHASLTRFQRAAAQAAAGQGGGEDGPAAAFTKLHISLKDAHGDLKTSGELFEESAEALRGIANPTERAGIASDLFGRSYARLLPLIEEGKEGIAKAGEEIEALGASMTGTFIEKNHEWDQDTVRLKTALGGLGITVIGELLPAMVSMAHGATEVAKDVVELAKHTKILQVGLGFLAVRGVQYLASVALTHLAKSLKASAKELGGMDKAVKSLGKNIVKSLAAFLLLEDVLVFLTGGKSVTGAIFDRIFGKGTTKEIQGIVRTFLDADNKIGLAGWGVALALKIVWTEIKYAALLAAAWIEDGFDKAWNGIVSGAEDALRAIGELFKNVPGFENLSSGIDDAVKKLEGLKLQGGNVDRVREERDAERLRIAAEGDLLAKAAEPVAKGGEKLSGAAEDLKGAAGALRGAGGHGENEGGGEGGSAPLTPEQEKLVPRYDKIANRYAKKPKAKPLPTPDGVSPALAHRFDAFVARFDGGKATVPAPAVAQSTTTVDARATISQQITIEGNVDKAGVPTLRKQLKQGAGDVLDLRAAQAALVKQSG